MSEETSYPLSWPIGQARHDLGGRVHSQFGKWNAKPTVDAARIRVMEELDRMGVEDWTVVISTNVTLRRDGFPRSGQKPPEDPGVAVYWTTSEDHSRVLACDRYLKVGCNLHAIAKHMDALRGIARWGCGTLEQAFAGYVAIPESTGGIAWWNLLKLEEQIADEDAINGAYKELAKQNNPDREGFDRAAWDELKEARKQGLDYARNQT